MEGLEAIQKRILADAREEAHEISRQAEKVLSDMMKQNQTDCDQVLTDARKSAESDADILMNRTQSLAALEQRKTILSARQALIEQTLQEAIKQLQQLSMSEKETFYARLIECSGLKSGQLILNQADMPIGEQLVKPYHGALQLDSKPGSFAGGVIIRQDLVEENLTFETLLKNNRPAWIKLASAVLFAEDKTSELLAGSEK